MILPGFLVFLLFLSAVPLAGSVCLGRRPERLFAAGLLANGLLFYAACAVNLCDAGFYAIFAGNLALCVPAALKLIKDPGAFRRFLTPAVRVFYLFLAAGFLLALREHLLWWDEFSHWSAAAKLLFARGKLNCALAAQLEHASYPPGLPVLDVLVGKCFVGAGFRDFMPRFAIRTAKTCVFLIPFGDAPKRPSFRECAAGMLIFWLVSSIFFRDGNYTCESDSILGVFFAAAVYVVMRHDRSVRDDLLLALLLAWLILVKKAGTGFAAMTLVLYAVRWIADRKSGAKRPVWSALVVLGAPFLIQASWSLLLKLHQTPIIFPVGKITPRGIWRLVRYGEPDYGWEIAALFGRQLLAEAPILAAVAAGLFLYRRRAEDRPRRDGDLCWFLPLALAVYMASLFLTYMFIFNSYQAHKLVSFRRYMHGFLVMPAGVLLMLAFSGSGGGKARRILTSYPAMALVLAGVAGFYVFEELCAYRIAKLWIRDKVAIEEKCGGVLRAPGGRFAVVTDGGGGIYHFIFRYEFGDNFAGETLLPPREPDEPYICPPAAELAEKFRPVRHVLFVRPRPGLAQEYAELWETPPEFGSDFTLFEVTPQGKLRPVR